MFFRNLKLKKHWSPQSSCSLWGFNIVFSSRLSPDFCNQEERLSSSLFPMNRIASMRLVAGGTVFVAHCGPHNGPLNIFP